MIVADSGSNMEVFIAPVQAHKLEQIQVDDQSEGIKIMKKVVCPTVLMKYV